MDMKRITLSMIGHLVLRYMQTLASISHLWRYKEQRFWRFYCRPIALIVILTSLFVVSVLLLASTLFAADRTYLVFGPTDYVRSNSKPLLANTTVTVSRKGSYILRIYNGGKQGQFGKSSSAAIAINGTQLVAAPGDFNQNTSYMDRTVILQL